MNENNYIANRIELLAPLLEAYPDFVNAVDSEGNGVLHLTNEPEVTRLMVESGADIDMKGKGGSSPLLRKAFEIKSLAREFKRKNYPYGEREEYEKKREQKLAEMKTLVELGANLETENSNEDSIEDILSRGDLKAILSKPEEAEEESSKGFWGKLLSF